MDSGGKVGQRAQGREAFRLDSGIRKGYTRILSRHITPVSYTNMAWGSGIRMGYTSKTSAKAVCNSDAFGGNGGWDGMVGMVRMGGW